MRKLIAPSMMCVDFARLEESVRALERAGADYLHFDIMDGSFVPNFTLGPDFIRSVRKLTRVPFDIHLMVQKPELHLENMAIEPGDFVSIHFEATAHVQRVLAKIAALGARPVLAVNPATPVNAFENVLDDLEGALIMTVNPGFAGQKLVPSTLRKITALRALLHEAGRDYIVIEADGNVSFENARLMSDAGANLFVGGSSSVFRPDLSIEAGVALLRESVQDRCSPNDSSKELSV